ncbi:hypothetical protein ACIQY5_21535 [Peribacillus frigoritolerans]|uniref:hypothetical protein n=1 Tax=Peribacillus frigoritolerans TaxID=450367 RepID=UPI0037F8A74C
MKSNKEQSKMVDRQVGKQTNGQETRSSLLDQEAKFNINDALASQFPKWDLFPPDNMVRRRRTKLL